MPTNRRSKAADRERQAREAVARFRLKATWIGSKEENRRYYRRIMEKAPIEFVIASARDGNKDALAILRERAREARRTGENVPTEFHVFVWEHFVDGPPKARPGTKPTETGLTYLTIALLVKRVHDYFGFPLDSGNVSAISIVADGLGMSDSRVRAIWGDWGKMFKAGQKRPS
jgi:hypothetical protein